MVKKKDTAIDRHGDVLGKLKAHSRHRAPFLFFSLDFVLFGSFYPFLHSFGSQGWYQEPSWVENREIGACGAACCFVAMVERCMMGNMM